MNGYVICTEEGGLEVWAELGHGDVMLAEFGYDYVGKILDAVTTIWPDEQYERLADVFVAQFGRDDVLGFVPGDENGDEFRAALYQAVSPGPPIEIQGRVSFKF